MNTQRLANEETLDIIQIFVITWYSILTEKPRAPTYGSSAQDLTEHTDRGSYSGCSEDCGSTLDHPDVASVVGTIDFPCKPSRGNGNRTAGQNLVCVQYCDCSTVLVLFPEFNCELRSLQWSFHS